MAWYIKLISENMHAERCCEVQVEVCARTRMHAIYIRSCDVVLAGPLRYESPLVSLDMFG